MTSHDIETSIRTRIQILGETLPVDSTRAWGTVIARTAVERSDSNSLGVRDVKKRGPFGYPRRLAVIGTAVTASVVASAIALLALGAGTAVGTPALPIPLKFGNGTHQQAVETLTSAAAAQTQSPAGNGAVRYAKTQNYALQTDVSRHHATTVVETTVRQVWISPGGSSVEKSWLQDTTRSGATVGSSGTQSTDSHWQDTNASLPTSPTAVMSALLGSSASADDRDVTIAQGVMSHLSEGTASAAQNASMYEVLANLSGVFDAGTVTDSAGRTGLAVGIQTGTFDAGRTCLSVSGPSSQVEQTLLQQHALGRGITYLIVDPTSGAPLEVEEVDTPSAPCGLRLPPQPTIEQYNVILHAGQVANVGVDAP
jgi:hypothetical protein